MLAVAAAACSVAHGVNTGAVAHANGERQLDHEGPERLVGPTHHLHSCQAPVPQQLRPWHARHSSRQLCAGQDYAVLLVHPHSRQEALKRLCGITVKTEGQDARRCVYCPPRVHVSATEGVEHVCQVKHSAPTIIVHGVVQPLQTTAVVQVTVHFGNVANPHQNLDHSLGKKRGCAHSLCQGTPQARHEAHFVAHERDVVLCHYRRVRPRPALAYFERFRV
eukprot:3939349-Rhodomonas_salina.3